MTRVLIVGNRGGTNIGEAFERALPALGYEAEFIEMRRAMQAPALVRRLNWYLRGKRPTRLKAFGREVVAACQRQKPFCIVATGAAPLDVSTLQTLARQNVPVLNYLTDDPWGRQQYAPWFLRALPHYKILFTTRRANIEDLRRIGCRDVRYLQFGYDPHWHFPQASENGSGQASDVFFAGGADADRVPFLAALVRVGLKVALYGDYWGRYAETSKAYRGYATPEMVRGAVSAAKVCLCLVRRANRDDHVMRTFEIPAMRGCMLAQDTETHRELFEAEGECVLYFKTATEMVEKTRWLLAHEPERTQMANNAFQRITEGKHTYRDRLGSILKGLRGERE